MITSFIIRDRDAFSGNHQDPKSRRSILHRRPLTYFIFPFVKSPHDGSEMLASDTKHSHGALLSEMPNYVCAEEPEASSGTIIEGRDIGRPVVADLGADLDLRADPMLPAGRNVDIARGIARALALHVIVELGAHREIVERADA